MIEMLGSFYPRVNEADVQEAGYTRSYLQPFYISQGKKNELKCQYDRTGEIRISDSNELWSMSEYGFGIDLKICIASPDKFFGREGKVDLDARIGIALIISSPDSCRTDVVRLGDFGSKDRFSIEKELVFQRTEYRRGITVRVAAYLSDPGSGVNMDGCPVGTILGYIDEMRFTADEPADRFPVVEKSVPGAPLWWVDCNWYDISSDQFNSDYVAVVINRAHKNYKLLDRSSPETFSEPMLIEVMSSAVQCIIEKAKSKKEEWEAITTEANPPIGSIQEAIKYIIETNGFDWSSPELLAKSIREYVEGSIRL